MDAALSVQSNMIDYPSSLKPVLEEPAVTTIVGICCTDGLVLGSDSKATKGPSVREEYLKIWDLDIAGFPAVITGAGRVAFIAKYRDLLRRECGNQRIQDVSHLVQIAEGAMQDMGRQYGTERMIRLGLLRGSDDDHRMGVPPRHLFPELQAVIGVYDGEPHLYFITPDGVAEEQQHFGATGSGGLYADYLLPKFCTGSLSVIEAALCAVHIVEQAKHVDPHSGGPTQIAVVTDSGVRHWTDADIAAATTQVAKIEQKASHLWLRAVKSQVRTFKGAGCAPGR